MRETLASLGAFLLCFFVAKYLRPDPLPPGPEFNPSASGPSAEVEPNVARPAPSLTDLVAPAQYESSEGSLSGAVRDLKGIGVPGVIIEVWPSVAEPTEESLPARVRAWVHQDRAREELTRVVATDERGEFEITDLVRTRYELRATHQRRTVTSPPESSLLFPGSFVELTASDAPSVEVEIQVIDVGGQPATDAFVSVVSLESASFSLLAAMDLETSPSWGRGWRFDGEPRWVTVPITVRLVAHGAGEHVSDDFELDVHRVPERVVLRLREPTGIVLSVDHPPGAEKTDLDVGVLRISGPEPISPARFSRAAHVAAMREGRLLTVPRRGSVTTQVREIPPGWYMVGVKATKRRPFSFSSRVGPPILVPQAWTVVEVTRGITRAHITIPEPGLEGAILARVFGPDGGLSSGLTFRVQTQRANGRTGAYGVEAKRRSDGSYAVRLLSEAALSEFERGDFELILIATHPDLGEVSGPVSRASPPEARLEFLTPGVIRLGLRGVDAAKRLERLQLRLGNRHVSSRIDGERLVVEGVAPGEYELVVSFRCGGGSSFELLEETIAIESGESTPVTAELPELHPLQLRCELSTPGTRVSLEGELVALRRLATFRDHKLLLPAGDYVVFESDLRDGEKSRELRRFSLPATSEVLVTLEENR